ncbi:bifunctional molybdenum cofactor biosynthesis protein MoaC/MoaB [Leadbetterella byssophila]|uniref:bifunctional molybdenum cofactor biosynthesis protein MoaC/MoaB n=1 Tax=Leadbetterella byssophila TaxID=316068 RepID=UPI00399FD182
MVDITYKTPSLRKAIASAIVQVSKVETIQKVKYREVPKGDVFEFSRAAALLGIKKTSDLIPDCHPLPVEYAAVRYSLLEMQIHIEVEVHTIYKTGVEVEAMHGASVAALVIYDMLKPIDKGVEIQTIKLLNKEGGKSDPLLYPTITAGVIVCSDRVSRGVAEDKSGKYILELLKSNGIDNVTYKVVSDDKEEIQKAVLLEVKGQVDLLLLSGGTGLSRRDITPEAVKPILDVEIPGIMEAARNHGQQKTKRAMLSRGIAGMCNDTLILTLPGSVGGVKESLEAIFPAILHVFEVRRNQGHT